MEELIREVQSLRQEQAKNEEEIQSLRQELAKKENAIEESDCEVDSEEEGCLPREPKRLKLVCNLLY